MPKSKEQDRLVPAPHQRSGVLPPKELAARVAVPTKERLAAGPVVMVECIENIPCNPCAYACPRKAITIEGELTDTPKVDFSKCNGCTLCISKCPGLAIFVVHKDYSKTEATVTIPYELLPRPEAGASVAGLDRAGRVVCKGRVVKMLDTKALNRCAVVTVAVPKRFWNTVRGIRRPGTRSELPERNSVMSPGRKGAG
jgi:Fe-S-cluster-containing hydrogenase component 2